MLEDHNAHGKRQTNAELNRDLLSRFGSAGASFWLLLTVLAALGIAGIVAVAVRLSAGFPNTPAWGYYAATVGYLLSTVMAAPIVIAGLRFTKAVWIQALSRAVFLFALPGVLFGLMFLPLLGTLPPLEGRASLWFDWPINVLRWVDTIAVVLLVVLALILLWLNGKPDWAVIRDHRGSPGLLSRMLARNWNGSVRQWAVLQDGSRLLGAFYILLYVFVTLLVSVDFDMSLIPGWRSPIYPAYHIITSAQAAISLVLVTIALLRRFAGLGEYLRLEQFWALGKLLLAFTLLWFYFFWSGFIVVWYGRMPQEEAILQITEFGPYFVPFALTVFLCFVVPFVLLIWNHIRKSVVGPPVAATSILIGLFFDRIRLYVPAYSIAGSGGALAGQVPPTQYPGLVDIAIIVGALAASGALYLVGTRLLPVISIWEVKRANLFSQTRHFLKATIEVVAKPE